jgi:CheY-like chemotaxis protein
MIKKRILVVDDEAGFTKLLKFNLERTGNYEVREENQATRACQTARIFLPDIILLDVVMPGMDGGDVVAELRRCPQTARIPVVMLTALVARDEISRHSVAEAGELIMLGKPVDMATLVRCLEEQLYLHARKGSGDAQGEATTY